MEKIGPIQLAWGKRRKKNKKGKIVKEWYLKEANKHLIWVKWEDVFEDDIALDDEPFQNCYWSAETQALLPGKSQQLKVIIINLLI